MINSIIISLNVQKHNFWLVHLIKTPIILRIRAVWQESPLSAWSNYASLAIKSPPSEDCNQNGLMRIFGGRTCPCSDVTAPIWVAPCKIMPGTTAGSEGPDQTAQMRSLIRAFTVRLQRSLSGCVVSLTDLELNSSHVSWRHIFSLRGPYLITTNAMMIWFSSDLSNIGKYEVAMDFLAAIFEQAQFALVFEASFGIVRICRIL